MFVIIDLIAWELAFRDSHAYPVRPRSMFYLQSSNATFRQYCFTQVRLYSELSDYYTLAQLPDSTAFHDYTVTLF